MKYLTTILLSLCALAFVGCGKKAVIEVPTFKSANINAYLKDYAAYCESAPEIYKDPAQFAQINDKMAAFAKRQAEVVKELQGEAEINAFNKCITDIRAHLEKVRDETLKAGFHQSK